MKRLIVLFFLLLQFSAFSQKKKPVSDPRFDGLDAAFNQVLKDWHAAGFAVAIVEKDKIVYAKGFGYRDVEKKLPVDANTLFAIGSCTKAFTATLIGKLVADGKLELDKPAVSYLPGLKFYNDNMNNTITARDMLTHVTGLPRHDYSWYFSPTESRDSLVRRIQFMEPTTAIRTKWQYNNFMYMALGAMDEYLSANTWQTDIRQKIFAPLKMSRSNVTVKDWIADPNASLGYGLKKDSTLKKLAYYNIAGMSPAGAINSSVNEMANWLIAWINEGKFEGKEVIPAAFRVEAISSQSISNGAIPGKEKPDLSFSNYGFGWTLASYKGHYRVEHGGNIDGFSASTSFFPTDSIGIVVLTNQNASSVPSVVRNIIADRMLGLKYFDWNADLRKGPAKNTDAKDTSGKSISPKPDRPATHNLKDYVGSYHNPGYGTLKISLQNDSLIINAAGKKIWLRHNNYDTFDMMMVDPDEGVQASDEGLSTQFLLSPGGDIEIYSVPFEGGLNPIQFKKQVEGKAIPKEALQKYVGDYEISGVTVKVFVKNEKSLYVFIPGQPEYELVAVDEDKFAIKIQPGFFVQFTVDGKGKVTELTFVQPNGNFKATKK